MALRVVVAVAIGLALIVGALLWLTRRGGEGTPSSGLSRGAFLKSLPMALGLAVLGVGGTVRFLWPRQTDNEFGSRFTVGKPDDVLKDIERRGVVYHVDGRFYLVAYDTSDPDDFYVREGVAVAGVMAIYQRCPHLGCRVPFCPTSGWFECPCHSAYFNGAGEYMGGPAPAGMWRFPIELDTFGHLVVDTSSPSAQPKRDYVSVDSRGRETPACVHF